MGALQRHMELVEAAGVAEAKHELADAVALYERAIAVEPWQRETYALMAQVQLHEGEIDAAWCTHTVMALVGDLDERATGFLEDHRPRRLPPQVRPLDDAAWRLLRQGLDDAGLEGLMPLIDETPPKAVPPEVFAWAGNALGLSMHEPARLRPRATLDVVVSGMTMREALFRSARELCRRVVIGSTHVVEQTALRAGVLLVGDIGVARDVLVAERRATQQGAQPRTPDNVRELSVLGMGELMVFAASSDHVHLRKHLGLSLHAADDLHG